MPHKLDKRYNDFGGLDTRSNKLLMNPKTQRAMENVEFDFQDEIRRRVGMQHKTAASGCQWGIFEYKYRDVNTGESVSQILGIDDAGNLNRKIVYRLKLTKASGSADHYSFYYNGTDFTFIIYDVGGVALGTVTVGLSDTLLDIESDINALAIAGLTADVVDSDGNSVSSTTALAYTLDWVVDFEIPVGDTYNEGWFWETVPTASPSQMPFPNVITQADNTDYQGPTAINLNNAIYLTDGGFPMKYDGASVYRAGMPKITVLNGFAGAPLSAGTDGALSATKTYKYVKQMGHVDINGVVTYGQCEDVEYYTKTLAGAEDSIFIPIFATGNSGETNQLFPVYSCEVNGDQSLAGTGSKVLTVTTGHNVKVGMCLRMPTYNEPQGTTVEGGFSWTYYEVTAVTATTITFNKTLSNHYFPLFKAAGAYAGSPYAAVRLNNTYTPSGTNTIKNGLVINACYVPDVWVGNVTEPHQGNYNDLATIPTVPAWIPSPVYGAFCKIYRTQGDGSILYELADVAVAHNQTVSTNVYHVLDELSDSDNSFQFMFGLSTIPLDPDRGEEIPRACSVLSAWQDTLVQTVRPIDPDSILGDDYPHYDAGTTPTASNFWGMTFINEPWQYTEANLCDFQSVYWADSNNPEGFPQDGLHEFLIDTVFNDSMVGCAPNKDSFFVFKNRSLGYLTGTLADNNVALEVLESDTGAVSHKSIQQVGGSIIYCDDDQGFFSVVAGRLPVPIGYPISDFFKNNNGLSYFRRTVATNFRKEDKYICYIPGQTNQTFVFDYAQTEKSVRKCWYTRSGIALDSILATSNDVLLASDRENEILWKQKNSKSIYDYSDHTSAINWVFKSAWINFGEPVVDKKFVKFWVNSIQGNFDITVSQYGNYLEPSLGDYDLSMLPESSTKKGVKDFVNINVDKLSGLSIGMSNNTIFQNIYIQGWELEFAPDFDPNEGRK